MADPAEESYPHYYNVKSLGEDHGFMGAKAVVNEGGTEYEFLKLSSLTEYYYDEEEDEDVENEEQTAFYRQLAAADVEKYNLHEKAKDLQKLFHVNESAFNPRNDRECELDEGLMRRAYMLSGLRSFAWTIADFCKKNGCEPKELDNEVVSALVHFVAERDWLNYNGNSHCKGLCAGSDLHVYYVPDETLQTAKEKLLLTEAEKKEYGSRNPFYKETFGEVHSLNALRGDLKYIYPAVLSLWESLEKERNYDEPLLGNEADIVYAWCALAFAAEEPFFSEDGPMMCQFINRTYELGQKIRDEGEKRISEEKVADAWLNKYGNYIKKNPAIDFDESLFVFSGLAGHDEEKDHPIVQRVLTEGGQYRKAVSGLTNYLVINPAHAGKGKISEAVSQQQKGKKVEIILLEDLINILEEKSPVEGKLSRTTKGDEKDKKLEIPNSDYKIDQLNNLVEYSGSGKEIILPVGICGIGEDAFLGNSEITSVVVPEGVTTIEDGAFWMCENLKKIALPSTLRKIGDKVFKNCEELRSIIIPEGCEEIGEDCFTNCSNLKDIYVPSSVYYIGDDAFDTFTDATVIHTPAGSAAEYFASHKIKVDNKRAPNRIP